MMNQFADHILAYSSSEGQNLTNLELQKVMYFSLGEYLLEKGIDQAATDIYDEKFEGWQYGPVIRSVYHKYRLFGRYPITSSTQINPKFEVFNTYINKSVKTPISTLIQISHEHKIWADNMDAILNKIKIEYELGDIHESFRNHRITQVQQC